MTGDPAIVTRRKEEQVRKIIPTTFMTLFAAAVSCAPLVAQSNDPQSPAPMQNPLEVTEHGQGGTSYYRFGAGPGDVTVTVDASTDNYSSPVEATIRTENGAEVVSISVLATDAGGHTARMFHLAAHHDLLLRLSTRADPQVRSLKYRLQVDGPTDLQAATVERAAGVTPDDDSITALSQLLSSIPALPSDGMLRIDMKDGTHRLIDLARIRRLSIVRSK